MDCQTAYTLTDLYTKDNDIDGVEKVLQHRLDNIPVYPGVKEPIHDEDFDAWEEIIGMLGRLRAPWLYEEDEEEETPLPVLHMMERCDVAEAKYEELHRQILLACCDSPDLNAVASIAHEQHKASGVKPEDVMDEDTIYDHLADDVATKEGLVDEDAIDYGPAFDNGKQSGYEDGFDEGEESGKEAERDEVLFTIEDMFRPLMSKVVAWEKEDDWDDQLRQIAERMEHHMMCQEQAETDCQNWQDRFEKK